jgi:asparagine synthase (glutamine-hydrolysing)
MCGIAGIINTDGRPMDPALVARMTGSIVHRGPDDEGCLVEGPVGLGSRRLSILDLSPAGHMPMTSADGTLTIAYNGEVYNFVELRAELEALGHRFRSHTDTEVILAAYAQWGPACLPRFNGMWGFAILDRRRQVLFCARDRFGVKPFHYVRVPGAFVFGSEIRQLLPFVDRRRARLDLLRTFIISGLCDHTDQTFFEGIEKLGGGHSLTYDLRSHSFAVERWYSLPRLDLAGAAIDEVTDEFERRFTSAVELRLRSDVRVGTCLSGGLDSSVIAAVAARLHVGRGGKEPFRAVTAISTMRETDESAYAKAVVDRCGLEWITTKPGHAEFLHHLDHAIEVQEEPFPTPSMIMQYFVMKAVREAGITVLLDGQGGDETLLGYPIYRGMYLRWLLRNRGVLPALAGFMRFRRSGEVSGAELLRYMVGAESASSRFKAYLWKHRYLHVDFPMPEIIRARSEASADFFELHRLEIFRTILPSLLRYEDRNSMAWSVESRLPFLDYRLVELSCSIPAEQKLHGGWSKYVLRRFADRVVPHEVAWRKSKFGFEAPDADWLRPLLPRMREAVVASPMLAQLAESSQLGPGFDGLDLRSQWRLFVCSKWEAQHGISGISG